MKNTKLNAFAVIGISFILGALAGYTITTIWSDAVARKPESSKYENVSEYVKERLDLNDDQAAVYDALLKQRRERMDEIRSVYRERMHMQTDSLRDELKEILRPEQIDEYEKFIEEYKMYRESKRKHK